MEPTERSWGDHTRPRPAAHALAPGRRAALGQPRRQPARPLHGDVPGRARAAARAPRHGGRRGARPRAPRSRRADRLRAARARDGAHARPARPPRLVRADRPERRAEPRLGGVRAVRDVARRERAHGAALRLRGALGLGARLRRAHRLARPGGADLVRAPVRAALRGLGGGGLDRLPRLVGARRRRRGRALVGRGEGGITLLAGRRPDRRHGGVVAPARGRLHALLPQPARRVLGDVGGGYFVPLVLLYGLGVLLALSRGLAEPSAIFTAIAAGGAASALALLALTVDEADEPFANVYSAAVSLQNLAPVGVRSGSSSCSSRAPPRSGRASSTSSPTRPSCFLLGSFFVPLFGVLAADFLLGAGRAGGRSLERDRAWAAGFALYQWIQPIGPAWWVDQAARGRPRGRRRDDRRVAARVRPRLRPLCRRTLRACAAWASSGSSRWIALTAAFPASAARRCTRRARFACSGSPAVVATKVADEDRARLSGLGVPVVARRAERTIGFRIENDGDRRHMEIDELGRAVHPGRRARLALAGARRRRLGARGRR